jgi:hypothetical protein
MNRKFSVIPFAVLIFLIGCSPSIKINREFLDPDFSFGQIRPQSKIKVFVSETINVAEFKGHYQEEYKSDRQFSEILQKQTADSMKAIIGCSAVPTGGPFEAAVLKSGGADRNGITFNQQQQLFGSAAENYFFVVTSVDITNKVSSNGTILMSSPGGGGTFASAGSSESCDVVIHADLWSVKNKRKILSYSSTGESKVNLPFYGEALKSAVANSIQYMVKYLAAGLVN